MRGPWKGTGRIWGAERREEFIPLCPPLVSKTGNPGKTGWGKVHLVAPLIGTVKILTYVYLQQMPERALKVIVNPPSCLKNWEAYTYQNRKVSRKGVSCLIWTLQDSEVRSGVCSLQQGQKKRKLRFHKPLVLGLWVWRNPGRHVQSTTSLFHNPEPSLL